MCTLVQAVLRERYFAAVPNKILELRIFRDRRVCVFPRCVTAAGGCLRRRAGVFGAENPPRRMV